MRKHNTFHFAGAAALSLTVCGVDAQTRPADYPKRPVRFIVAQTAGGNADFVARIIAGELGKRLGQQFVVDNRPGAGGIIAAETTVNAPPDGYTLMLAATGFSVNPALYKKLPYDSLTDLAPITQISYGPQILVVSPSFKAQSVKDLIALAKSKPGALNYGISSVGGATQLAAELFSLNAGVKMTAIPYKGAPAMIVDLMAGRIDLSFATMPSSLQHVRAGKLRALAVTSLKRSAQVPEVPTIAETAIPGYEMVAWQGLFAPKATPRALIQFLNSEVRAITQQPDVRKQLSAEGGEPVANSPEEFAKWLRAEIAKWTKVVQAAGIKPE